MHEQIRKIEPPCPYLMPSLGYRLNLKQRRFRLYLPYQPGGDAKDLRKMNEHAPPRVPYHAPSLDFIFYTFLAMTEACLALDSGWWGDHQPSEAEMMENNCRKEGWVPIVHRDIKSRNTFLGEPGGDRDQRWSMYPTPIIGDFGLSFEAYPDDQYNPENWFKRGTTDYAAPEQRGHRPLGCPNERKLSDRTNVYGIGAVIFELWQGMQPGFWGMNLDDEKFEKAREQDDIVDADYGNMGVLPAIPGDERALEGLFKYYKENPPNVVGQDIIDEENLERWLEGKRRTEKRGVGGAEGSLWYIYLFELEFWKPHWLLRYLHKPDSFGLKNFDNDKEKQLADILRECLTWDADVRPSILKLRSMVKAAIDELNIKPNNKVEYVEDAKETSPLPRKLRYGGGLLYPMGETEPGGSVERFVGPDRSYHKADAKKKSMALWEAYRRTRLQRLRPISEGELVGKIDIHGKGLVGLDVGEDSGGVFGDDFGNDVEGTGPDVEESGGFEEGGHGSGNEDGSEVGDGNKKRKRPRKKSKPQKRGKLGQLMAAGALNR